MEHSSESSLVGRMVIDLRHEPIGKVVDVIFEDGAAADPRYAVVQTGVLRTSRYVPVREFSRTGDGRIVVPFDAEKVKSGPKAAKDHIVSNDLEHRMAEHYGIDD